MNMRTLRVIVVTSVVVVFVLGLFWFLLSYRSHYIRIAA